MREADWVIAMDTGSTDGTQELLRAEGVTVFEQMVPPGASTSRATSRCRSFRRRRTSASRRIWTSCSARLAKCARSRMVRGRKARALSLHVELQPDGSDGVVFWADKIHVRHGFRWEKPVHEVLEYERSAYRTVLADGLQLNHRPDPEKSRHQYLPLLELAVRESRTTTASPTTSAANTCSAGCGEVRRRAAAHLKLESAVWPGERSASMRFIARAHRARKPPEAERWLLRAIAEAPHLREPWVDMASLSRRLRTGRRGVLRRKGASDQRAREVAHPRSLCVGNPSLRPPRGGALRDGRVREALFVPTRRWAARQETSTFRRCAPGSPGRSRAAANRRQKHRGFSARVRFAFAVYLVSGPACRQMPHLGAAPGDREGVAVDGIGALQSARGSSPATFPPLAMNVPAADFASSSGTNSRTRRRPQT